MKIQFLCAVCTCANKSVIRKAEELDIDISDRCLSETNLTSLTHSSNWLLLKDR